MTADSAALLQSHQHHANGTHLTRYASLINRLPRHTAHLLIAPDQEALRHRTHCAFFSFASNTTGRDCAVAGGVVVACGGA
ncbi:hypothetical protein Y032_0293g1602 [Ancylostoma ceylanicum]|uniref:Uncharacterized protein n=1 Tax=Ancylostoma ceylanicum TaxID=53326 RepID=A0A016S606_9BILA|nr:hypothetical protein Y032_0293g1602 [Ancylostoma ceylanicum]